MLVLLIIFMIASPLIQKGVEVTVPKTAQVTPAAEVGAKLLVRVRREGASDVIYVGERKVTLPDVAAEIQEGRQVKFDQIVCLDASPAVAYGMVEKVMAAAQSSGAELGLVTRD